LFGYLSKEALGQSLALLAPESDAEEDLLGLIRRGESTEPFEAVRRRKDGSDVDVSIQFSPLKSGSGELIGSSQIARDITELKRRDADLKRSNAELEQFAYVASHDLQEPLRMVANYTELLAERYRGQLDEKADKYIYYASDGARRMQRLVTDLLAYSRVGSQGKPPTPIGMDDVLDNVLISLKALTRETHATVVRQSLPTVMADEVQLHQLLQNLLGNAIKFRSAAAPRIEVNAVREGAYWKVGVTDNGIGMEMKYAERIFQMFQRLHEIGKYEGSGIGLAIAKRIVERHGGTLSVESQPGHGTTFFFTLRAVPLG
jgi:light-regulated signal transduction histidine kinase (bacteriophytochrome)